MLKFRQKKEPPEVVLSRLILKRYEFMLSRERRPPCEDCPSDTLIHHSYMVKDSVWKLSGLSPNGGYLCLYHLESRIGRKLTVDDFTKAPINSLLFFVAHMVK